MPESEPKTFAGDLASDLRLIASCQLIPWEGFAWRCHARRYDGADHGGSLKATGRFHRASDKYHADEIWPALYTGLAEHVALGEGLRHLKDLSGLARWRTSKLQIRLSAVVDGCSTQGCRATSITGAVVFDLCQAADYRLTHEVAQEARRIAEALLVPSCTRFPEGCLVVFPDRLRPESEIKVVETTDPDLHIDWSTYQ